MCHKPDVVVRGPSGFCRPEDRLERGPGPRHCPGILKGQGCSGYTCRVQPGFAGGSMGLAARLTWGVMKAGVAGPSRAGAVALLELVKKG